MSENETTPDPASRLRPGARFRIAGILILLIGLAVAGLVYWLSAPAEALPDELATPENNKRAARDVQSNFGKMGAFSYALDQDLKDPAIQAAIIGVVSVLMASGCFYVARLQARDPESHPPPA